MPATWLERRETGRLAILRLFAIFMMMISTIGCSKTVVKMPSENHAPANIARDGNIAIQEEFEAAKAKNTIAAYEHFIARHPKHPLTEQAKVELAGLQDKNPQKR